MKTILVPTDFSKASDNAFDYAVSLASKLHSRIILLHAYQASMPVAEVSFSVLNEEHDLLQAEADKKLKALATKTGRGDTIAYEWISDESNPKDLILQIAKEKKADLIVMGATGQTGRSGVIFGSTSLKVMEKANCPVMAIPADFAMSKPITRITFATDYHRSDLAAIEKAAEIAGATGAQLTILHICDAVIGADEEKTLMHHFMEKVKKVTLYPNLSFRVIHGYAIEERLEQYVEDESVDMLMMATHYRTFFDRLFGDSITKKVSKSISIPVVAFHYNAKTALTLY